MINESKIIYMFLLIVQIIIIVVICQNEVESGEELGFDALLSNDSWESLDAKNISGTPLFRVSFLLRIPFQVMQNKSFILLNSVFVSFKSVFVS